MSAHGVSCFSHCWEEIADGSNLREEVFYFGSQFQGNSQRNHGDECCGQPITVRSQKGSGRTGMPMLSRPSGIINFGALGWNVRWRLGLPTSVNLICNDHAAAQSFISKVIVDAMLTVLIVNFVTFQLTGHRENKNIIKTCYASIVFSLPALLTRFFPYPIIHLTADICSPICNM